jgi:mRNA-degrading endonuclease HigB of HigAB toxin-antitoxin module
MGIGPCVGNFLVDGEEYVVKYEETPKLKMPFPTGVYRMDADGTLDKLSRIEITGNSYIGINRITGQIDRIYSRYITSIDRHDNKGGDLVAIIKKSIVEWVKIK